jgi:hypothetical protein
MIIKEKVKEFIRKKRENDNSNDSFRDIQDILNGNTGFNAQSIFNASVLSWIFVLATLFLQLISLSTTYSGSKVYFGGITLPLGLSAPLLFAISIQLTLFSLSNSLKKNYRIGITVILLAATLCSTYFSYIGIYNYINSPITYLEERYNQIYHNMNDKYQIAIDNSKNQLKDSVFDITSKVQKEYTRLLKENDSYSKLKDQVAKISMEGNVVKANTSSVAKPNISKYGDNLDKYYEDMNKYNAAISNITGEAAVRNSSSQSAIYENKIKTILGGKSLEEFTKEFIEVQSNKEVIDNLITSMYSHISSDNNVEFNRKLSELQQYCINYIDAKKGSKEEFNTVLTNMYNVYSNVTSTKTPETLKDTLNFFYTINDSNIIFMKSLKDVEKGVYYENYGKEPANDVSLNLTDSLLLYSKIQSEIKNGAYLLNSFYDNETVIDLKDSKFKLDNMYILPIKNLFTSSSSLTTAWFCFVFAALIDGLTLLFGLMSKGSSRTLLARKNREIIRNDEEMTEELLLSSLILGPIDEAKDKRTVELCLENLAGFINKFSITNITMESGYSLYCPLNKLKKYHVFLSVLCQFNLARIISKNDFKLLQLTPTFDDFKHTVQEQAMLETIDEAASTINEEEEADYVLIKTKFVIWVNRKFSIASSNKKLSSSTINILKAMKETNELS